MCIIKGSLAIKIKFEPVRLIEIVPVLKRVKGAIWKKVSADACFKNKVINTW